MRSQLATASFALAAVLCVGGCRSTNQAANSPQQDPNAPAQGTAAPSQQNAAPAQQAMNPESAPQRTVPRERTRESERARQGAYAPAPGQSQAPYGSQAGGYAPQQQPREATVIPAGTHIVVTLGQTVSSKTSQPGDSFSATVAEPVVVGGSTVIRAGAPASGTVVDAKSLGRFKGQATLSIRLDSVRAEGRSYQVASSTVERVEQGKGKRTAVITGGGGGLGALIGGLAGGGKGALIGGLAGAGAGGAGSAFTGNKDLVIPAETQLTFRLERDVRLQ